MASRILGMGDVLTLIEKAEQEYDAGVAEISKRLQAQADHLRRLPRGGWSG